MSDDYMDITPTELEDKLVAKLLQDTESENPRQSFDHAGTLVCENDNYDLSDKDAALPAHSSWHSDRTDIELSARYIELKGGVALPLRFSDYGSSGATIHETSADDANALLWCDRDKLEEEWAKHGSPDPKAAALACLKSECEELNQYLQGEVYGYVIESPDGEFLDSCWGFYGDDYATDEAQSAAKHCAEEIDKRAASLTAARGWAFARIQVGARLEYLRGELRAERISWSELAELQSLAAFIDPGDVELLEPAGVPENGEES
jgi:hypothetical protein